MLESIENSRFVECMPVFLTIGRIRKNIRSAEYLKFIFYSILLLTGFAIAVLFNNIFRLRYGYKLVGMIPY